MPSGNNDLDNDSRMTLPLQDTERGKGNDAEHDDDDDAAAAALLRAAQECDAEYADLVRTERLLKQGLDKLRTHEAALVKAIGECSETSQPEPTINRKKQQQTDAIRRLEQALMVDSSSSEDEDKDYKEHGDDDVDCFAIL
ncbi:hypothetical protein MPSEU_000943400 [Mayamaea pseudoterrestris]|nr:hypothetical protein MPSEU_000943400 [Mayamaea pseudoterrestris]